MKRKLKTPLVIPLLAAIGITSGCATIEQASVDVAASMVPDPDFAIARPDFASEVAIKRIAYKLDLDREQLEKLRAIKSEIIAIRQEERLEQDHLINAWIAELRKRRMDETTIHALMKEREILVERYAPRVMEKVIVFHASLNDEQKDMLTTRTERLRDWQPSS